MRTMCVPPCAERLRRMPRALAHVPRIHPHRPVAMTFNDYLDIFRNRRIGAMLVLGFASGLPLALTSGTLQAWMTVEGLDIKTIGFFSLVGQAYIFKFLWAPLMDRYTPPLLGRRRGWLVLTQIALVAGIIG